ncbi:hypothetical protein CU040_1978 [Enterococcus faecium]|nr:hypothetical protein [Enterococcus faecium]
MYLFFVKDIILCYYFRVIKRKRPQPRMMGLIFYISKKK